MLGYGRFGNNQCNDALMEQLADSGDGFYAYVDDEQEAVRLFKEGLTGTLLTVAKDAKVRVEFNKDTVAQYRLLGFENRAIADKDFDRQVDAGEIGAGHSVTALYEVQLVNPQSTTDELATVALKWEDPTNGEPKEMFEPISGSDLAANYDDTNSNFQLTSAVAAWAEILRESQYVRNQSGLTLETVADEANRISNGPMRDNDQADEFSDLTNQVLDLR